MQSSTGEEYAEMTNRAVIFTPMVFLLCAVLLIWEFSLNDWTAETLTANPSYGPSLDTLLEAGAKRADLIVDDGEWWRLITREWWSHEALLWCTPKAVVCRQYFML